MAKIKAIHRRVNGWRIGDYCVFEGNGFRAIGQLENIGTNDFGYFKGFIIFSMRKKYKPNHPFDWGLYLQQTDRDALFPNVGNIETYESICQWLPGNKQ